MNDRGKAPGSAAAAEPVEKGGIGSALKGMLSFFTVFRLNIGMKEMDAMERKFGLAPILGFLIGFLTFLVCLVLRYAQAGWLLCAAVALVMPLLLSKFLHFDGLTDFGDGMIVSSGKREDHIRALKDTLIGAGGFGVALTVTLISFCGYASMVSVVIAFTVWPVEVLTKNAMVIAAACGKPGNGMAARQVSRTGGRTAAVSLGLSVLLLAAVLLICRQLALSCGWCMVPVDLDRAIILYAAAFLASSVTGLLMARTANRTFGFVNGDILGATNEVSRAVMLAVCSILTGLMMSGVI